MFGLEKIETFLAKKLKSHLKHYLDLIPPHIRVSCKLSDFLWQCDKKFSGCCNCVKGSVHDFLYYREQHHPGAVGPEGMGRDKIKIMFQMKLKLLC